MGTEKKETCFVWRLDQQRKQTERKGWKDMFLADCLQNEIKTSFRAFLWKGCGRRREEQEAARLQQSTDALFCDRQDSGTAGLCCTWATPVQVSVAPKWQQLNVGTRGTGRDQERGAEQSWQLTNFVDKWSRERGIGCIVGHPCPRTGPRSLPAQCSRQGRHQTESLAPGVPSLKSSSKEEMSRFAFSHRSTEGCSSIHYSMCSGLPQACS